MRNLFFLGVLILYTACSEKIAFVQGQQIQLANPIIDSDSVFFTQDLELNLNLGLDNVEIRYTLDDSEPTVSSRLFSEKIVLTKTATIKARAFHADYLPSETVSTQFIKTKSSISIKNITLNREAHESYQAQGALSLIDHVKGTKYFKSGAYLGFAGGDLEIVLEYTKNEPISRLILSLLSDQKSWIFLPKSVEIYTANQGENYSLVAEKDLLLTKENSESEFRFVKLDFSEQKADFVKVILKNIKEIPAWHPGKGTPPWLFIDEILVE